MLQTVSRNRYINPLYSSTKAQGKYCNTPSINVLVRLCTSEFLMLEGNVLDLQVTGIKTECVDHSYDVKTEKTVDETAVLIDFPVVKSEVEEGNVLDLHRTEIKAECVNQRYDMKPEITFVEIPVPIDCSIVKNEVQDEACELDKVEELRLEVTAEEDEVLTEGRKGCTSSNFNFGHCYISSL
ncbi:uncharacterized protein [Periplaneta americana]|uniref:uncharacterized protein isoform X8 n=1 Tax=Periplaneta americana TaxID=6978 RepID=UPI0037E80946